MKFARTNLYANVVTIGHLNHGHTMLTPAITSVLAVYLGVDAKHYDPLYHAAEEYTSCTTSIAPPVKYMSAIRHCPTVLVPSPRP